MGCELSHSLDDVLPRVDAVNMLRIQFERISGQAFPSLREYATFYGLTARRLAKAKKEILVMHPGPMNRGVEIDGLLADDINVSVIQQQVEMGVAVRMAAMDLLARNHRAGNAATATAAW
jgi:aspartate carbamoyltransferase catalytic subunit